MTAKARKSARATQRITIDEVARHAGVSPMTVSRVVNGGKYVRDDTRETVMAAVRKLNYMPNPAARTLAGAGGERIGLLYGNPSAAYLSEFLLGALEESSRSGAQLVLEKCEPNAVDSKRAVRKLVEGAVAGVILPPPLCESALIRKELQTAGLPIVAVAAGRPPPDVSSVRVHDYEAAYEMTKYLLDLGHKYFGFIKGHPNQTASEERWRGFQAALKATHEKLPEPQVEQGFFSYRSGLDAAKKLLGGTNRPTAIFASNDDMAAAVVSEAHRLGLDVPRDLSVVGFDNTLIASTVWPELTTVQQPVVEMAAQAVAMLLKEIRSQRSGHPPAHEHKVIGHALITRGSAAPPHAR